MDLALYTPVEVTDMRIVAKAAIVVYQEIATGRLFIDPDLPSNPLFRLGDVKGDTGAAGADGAAGAQGVQGLTGAAGADGAAGAQGVQGLTGAAGADGAAGAQGVQGLTGAAGADGAAGNIPYVLDDLTVNAPRTGAVAGLILQQIGYLLNNGFLTKKIVVFRGMLKLVSTSTGTGSMLANIGGLIFTFPNITIAASTQYLHFEVTACAISSGVGFASVRQSIALNGVAGTAVQANNVAQSGAASTNTALIQFKSPTTTQVTTLFAVCEVL